jgi:(S)-2-hydroxy-acid oxidase
LTHYKAVKMHNFVNLEELEGLAKSKLPAMVYDYYAGGANSQWTVGENRRAFSNYRILPRMLVDVSKLDISTDILGKHRSGKFISARHPGLPADSSLHAMTGYKSALPMMVAPMAMHGMAHPDRELATARAAAAAGIPMVRVMSATVLHVA